MKPPNDIPTLRPRLTVGFDLGRVRVGGRFLSQVIDNMFRAASQGDGHMRKLLESWREAGCRWNKWEAANSDAATRLQSPLSGLRNWHVWIRARSDGKPAAYAVGATAFEPGEAGKANTDEELAFDIFALFIVAAGSRAEVGKCERCDSYYWNRWGHTNKRFCMRKCAQRQTAIEGQEKRLARERLEKNKRLRQAIREFVEREPAGADWREWVCGRAGVSKSFLTRSLRRAWRGHSEGLTLTKRQRQFLEKGNGQ